MTKQEDVKARLEYLRGEIRAERISYGELSELQGLAEHIPADDLELREAAGLHEWPDVHVTNCGSIVQFELLSQAAREWFDENVQSEDWQWLGNRLGVDHRYADNLIAGIIADGLTIE